MDQLIKSLCELEKLKTIERGLTVGNRKESSAEHSWSCLLIADILLDQVDEELDRLKVFEYLIYHDVPEVYAGDAKFNNPEEMKLKEQKEAEAIQKILSFIPNPQRFNKFLSEYEHRQTREAEFAKAIDCIDSCIRNLNDNNNAPEIGFTADLIRNKYRPHVSKFSLTNQLFEEIMKQLITANKLSNI